MEIFKWVLLLGIVAFLIWQIILLAKQIIERDKNKKEKQKLDETKVVATDIVDNKEEK